MCRGWQWGHIVPHRTPTCAWGGRWERLDLCHVILWHRYIDGTRSKLDIFMGQLGHNESNLKFTIECSQKRVMFLDVQIGVDEWGNLFSNLYKKPSSANTILYAKSAHPKPLVHSIPYGQYLRLMRNCTREEDFQLWANELQVRLLKQGYRKMYFKKAFNRSKQKNRHSLIQSNKQKTQSQQTRLITRFSQQRPHLPEILALHWHLLTNDAIVAKYVSPKPAITCRRAKSLKDHLTRSHLMKG